MSGHTREAERSALDEGRSDERQSSDEQRACGEERGLEQADESEHER